jgi:hypothetical protein
VWTLDLGTSRAATNEAPIASINCVEFTAIIDRPPTVYSEAKRVGEKCVSDPIKVNAKASRAHLYTSTANTTIMVEKTL